MRIGIDAGPLLGQGGISGYVSPLVRSLLAMDPETRYQLVLRRGWLAQETAGALDALAPVTRVPVPDRLLTFWWDDLGWTLPFQRSLWGSLDVFLATCLFAPVLPQGRVVSIVYDLTPLRLPGLFAENGQFRRAVERLLRRSAAVVVISERTRQDLVELLGADPARLRVIYPGRGEAFRPVPRDQAAEVARRLGIRGRYILYVGALGPHKNVPTLLRAYQRARREGGLAAELVVAGSPRWGGETLAVMESLEVRDGIVLAGPVSPEDLPALYSGADLFVFPSRYEGFGLPVLEAMACGTPVIVSNRGALPEVAGEAGCYVDPDDEAALAAAMCRIFGEPEVRARMAAAGLERAACFSWARSAADLLALFREVARAPRASFLRSGGNGPGARRGPMPKAPGPSGGPTFYDRDYFEGRTRQSPPHTRELIYPLAERTAAFLCRRCRPPRVLDIGCAKGYLIEAFRAQGTEVAFGLDVSLYAVSVAGAATRGRLVVADVQAGIPLRSGSFDLITGLDLFEHLEDPGAALREIRRVLSDVGVAYLKICHPCHPNARRDPSHVNVQPLSYWRREFHQAGFGWERLYETDFVVSRGPWERLKAWVRRWREWAVIGTPADYKFLLRKRADGRE
jgi:glycosyltransferase involved in cell wall biosynthesis/SAM-dependent methyltransferase